MEPVLTRLYCTPYLIITIIFLAKLSVFWTLKNEMNEIGMVTRHTSASGHMTIKAVFIFEYVYHFLEEFFKNESSRTGRFDQFP